VDLPEVRQRRRLKRFARSADQPRGPVARPLAVAMTALTAAIAVAVVVLFAFGTLTSDRIGGNLLIPMVLLVVADVYVWSRLSDDAHPIRHPVRFARVRWEARTPRRRSVGGRLPGSRNRRNP
jgi:hypothetical protein